MGGQAAPVPGEADVQEAASPAPRSRFPFSHRSSTGADVKGKGHGGQSLKEWREAENINKNKTKDTAAVPAMRLL